jgi:predicted DNA-binding protein with PD1-like motif
MPRDYKADLNHEWENLERLFCDREDLEIRIAKQQQRVAALAALTDQEDAVAQVLKGIGGLTNACRAAFRAAGPRGLTPVELRDALKRFGFRLSDYRNAMASIHAVIGRLENGGEIDNRIRDIHEGRNESVYVWALSSYGASRSLANQFADAERDKAYTKQQKNR